MGKNDVNADIRKIIAENLPATTAGVMSDYITEAERTKDDLAAAGIKITAQEVEMKIKNSTIEKLKEQVSEINVYKTRDMEVAKMAEELRIEKRDIDLKIALIELDAANDRNDKIEQLVEKVFGHPSVTVSTSKIKPLMPDENGNTPYLEGRTMVETEDTTTTKSKK